MSSTALAQRLLYVDDRPSERRSFARDMRGRGFIVDLAGSGADALRLTRRQVYSVVVTDLCMPGMNGLSLVEQIHNDQPSTPCILLTGEKDFSLPQEKGRTGSNAILAVLSKPWDLDEVCLAVQEASELGQRHSVTDVPSTRTRVLLLEGCAADGDLVLDCLGNDGHYDLKRVVRLSHAADFLHAEKVDAVLTDLSLPDARGLDTVRRLHRLASEAAIVVLSSMENEQLALQAMRLGAQDYLIKADLHGASLRRAVGRAIERKRAERQLVQLAHYDQLTGLANRATFLDRLEHALEKSRRQETEVAVMFLDLDRFKMVNDSLGHDIGDQLLRVVADRVVKSVRAVDTVARFSGDEFGVLLEFCDGAVEPNLVAQRIISALQQPVVLGSLEVLVTASIGLVIRRGSHIGGEALVRAADAAMFEAKRQGRNQYYVDTLQEQTTPAHKQLSLEAELRRAVENGNFLLHFQPQVNMHSNRMCGAEALIRLKRSDNSLLPPMEFIPLLEDTGLISQVSAWILHQACGVLAGWRRDGHRDCTMAVNLSAHQFQKPGLVDTVADTLTQHGVPPEALELEITESMLMRDIEVTNETFAGLKRLGVRIAIDDFGTGYSSLAYLHRFRVDVLKIDPSFVKALSSGGRAASVAGAIVGLGHKLGLSIVAEGVESADQLRFLKSEGCDVAQGFFLGRPVPTLCPGQYAAQRDAAAAAAEERRQA